MSAYGPGCTPARAREIITGYGRNAYQTGVEVNRCPYTPDQDAYAWWLDGWNDVKADHEDAMAGARS
jgi:ribosome modulation factor